MCVLFEISQNSGHNWDLINYQIKTWEFSCLFVTFFHKQIVLKRQIIISESEFIISQILTLSQFIMIQLLNEN